MIEDEHKGNADKVKSERDRVMSKFGWAWLQVTPLCQEYAQNVCFLIDSTSTGSNLTVV